MLNWIATQISSGTGDRCTQAVSDDQSQHWDHAEIKLQRCPTNTFGFPKRLQNAWSPHESHRNSYTSEGDMRTAVYVC